MVEEVRALVGCWMQVSFIPGESCLNGSFRDMAGTSPDCHWKGLALKGSGEGKERAGLAGGWAYL